MRVAVIYLGRRGPGGPISLELATHLSPKTDIFAVVSTQADHYARWQESGIDLISAPTFSSDFRGALSLLSQGRLKSLAESIAGKRPDAIVYPMVHPWTPFLQRYLRDIPHVVTVHDATPHPGLKHFASSLWERMSARQASRCVVMSPRFIESLAARGIPAENIDIIPHGIFSFYAMESHGGAATNGVKSILFFGRITAYKGLEVLLQAFEIIERRRKDVRLDVVGAGDLNRYDPLLKKIRNINVVNRWVGDDEVAPAFRQAALVVLPYTTASQSGVIPLAASFRVPVVATTVGALPDQIRNGETGILVKPDSVKELVDAIDHLLDNPELAARMGENLSKDTAAVGDWDRIADAYLESCRKAVSAPRKDIRH
jgi:glycosyltransferase involved in cell wall biosynthesis